MNGTGRHTADTTSRGNILAGLLGAVLGLALVASVMTESLAGVVKEPPTQPQTQTHHLFILLSGMDDPDETPCPYSAKPPAEEPGGGSTVIYTVDAPEAAAPPEQPSRGRDPHTQDRMLACPIRNKGYDHSLWPADGTHMFPLGCL